MQVVIVTGMSGAGKSTALHSLEDMGFYCMDNFPPQLMMNFLQLAETSTSEMSRIALGIDLRGGNLFEKIKSTIDLLQAQHVHVHVLYLEATDECLVRRYKELRRPHPSDKAGNIFDGIQREKSILAPIRALADTVVDTTGLTLGEFKRRMDQIFLEEGEQSKIFVTVTSFGYKNGILLDADLVFDARFLPNPYYVAELRPLTGRDPEVRDYIFGYVQTKTFLDKITDLLDFLLPYYIQEGKRTLTVGIGCTGGRHRSVALAEALGEQLLQKNSHVLVTHRDQSLWK
ncbi:MAG: RNase adapter RapZ [Peptoniphilaceae bacterium]|nr:RNase adapter RapZ [Peptoniphilaceae bacterium]MCI6660171.1 RNase adapter RapZ [Peptoniphilaceae bacterium]MDD7433488.1 RNase adapter RapZ [Peptoniphilaceae bacterium]MDY3076254.1 RNase adapter RapZ [Peptoniphilaceae bacterium]MDY3986464.1 RNase adapter RapZ [Peptoniphilaceae bacterium]